MCLAVHNIFPYLSHLSIEIKYIIFMMLRMNTNVLTCHTDYVQSCILIHMTIVIFANLLEVYTKRIYTKG